MEREKTVILIRTLCQSWQKFAVVDSIEEAEKIWQNNIKGKGITAWTEFVSEKKAKEMLNPH